MKNFVNVMSTNSIAIFATNGIIMFVVLFEPSILELLIMVFVDFLAFLAIHHLVDMKLYKKMFPDCKAYFPIIKDDIIAELDTPRVKQLLISLSLFPRRRSLYIFIANLVKVIPAGIVVVYFWEYNHTDYLQLWVKFWSMEFLILSFFSGIVFIETHNFASKKIEQWHQKLNWQQAFEQTQIIGQRQDFFRQESIALLSLTISIVILVFVANYDQQTIAQYKNWKTLGVLIPGLVCLGRLYYLNRTYFLGGLENIFNTFDSLEYSREPKILPIHTSSLLAKFENTFNSLSSTLQLREKEIKQWAIYETEQSNIREFGEISGLIAHDLVAPLNALQFCVEGINDNPQTALDPEYMQQMLINTNRAVELIESLRAYLKNPIKQDDVICNIITVQEYVKTLLKGQFLKSDFEQIAFVLDDKLGRYQLNIDQMSLVHVLYNLYKNSVTNLLDHKVENPLIKTLIFNEENNYLSILIQDNGSGLTNQTFEELTNYKLIHKDQKSFRKGLGLRLTRRLIERHEGELTIFNNNINLGTTFKLSLRVHS